MSGSGGGGGGSGTVDYPSYMKEIHEDWLRQSSDVITNSVTDIMNSALGSSPWSAVTAYPVATDINSYITQLNAFSSLLSGLDDRTDWANIYLQAVSSIGAAPSVSVSDISAIADLSVGDLAAVPDISVTDADGITDAAIITDTDAFADQLDDEIANKVLPRFRRGMQDIGAVVSSSFAIGEAIIEGFRDRDVSRHASTLRVNAALKNAEVGVANMDKDVRIGLGNQAKDLEAAKTNMLKDVDVGKSNLSKSLEVAKANQSKDIQVGDLNSRTSAQHVSMFLEATSQMSQNMINRISFNDSLAKTTIEAYRIKIVANKEMYESNNTYNENDALWDLEVFQYGANVMASIGGGTAVQSKKKSNPMASALGGAFSGASSGAMIGGMATSWTGPGAAIGATIGAILGAGVGLLGS